MKYVLTGAAALLSAMALAAPAEAALPAVGTPCASTDIVPNATSCAGFYDGNLINGSPADIQNQKDALALLGFTWDGSTLITSGSGLNGATTINFDTTLYGLTIIGAHFGNGQGGPGNATAFWVFDAGAGLTSLTLNYNASSNYAVYSTGSAVPEPATWMMMLAGFGAVGGVMARRRRKTVKPVAQIA